MKQKEGAALAQFHKIAEAYEVLSSPQFRSIYDQFGYEWLFEGFPPNKFMKFKGVYNYRGNAEEIFTKVFGSFNPYIDLITGLPETYSESLASPVQLDLWLTLEEMYFGCRKELEFERLEVAPDCSQVLKTKKALNFEVKPGMGVAPIVVPQQGNMVLGKTSSDLILNIKTKKNKHFSRKGNDLCYISYISLIEALDSVSTQVTMFDSRTISVSCDEVINPKTVLTVPGHGMPIYKTVEERMKDKDMEQQYGDLIILFEIRFPSHVKSEYFEVLREIL